MTGGFRYESLRFSASNKVFLNQPFNAVTTCLSVCLFQLYFKIWVWCKLLQKMSVSFSNKIISNQTKYIVHAQ